MNAVCPRTRAEGIPPACTLPYLCYLPHLSALAPHFKLHQAHFPPGGGNGNPLQYSYLGNPRDRGAWRATVHGVTRESDTEHNKVIPNRTPTTSPARQGSTQQTCSLSWTAIRPQTLRCFRILCQGVLCVAVLVAQAVSDFLQPHDL